jgi:hypothetical protein
VEISTPVGIGLVVLGVYLAFKAYRTALKLAFLAIVGIGLYLWFVA